MQDATEQAVHANTAFAESIILRAANIVTAGNNTPGGGPPVIDALRQARDAFLETESAGQRKHRTYYLADLLNDIKWYLVNHEGANPDSFAPISEWRSELDPKETASTLCRAIPTIVESIAQKTRQAGQLQRMDDKQLAEHILMHQLSFFLREHGINIEVAREGNDPNAPLDYRGAVNGIPWAFELTQLRQDPPKHFHREVGHPKERKSIEQQLNDLEEPLPKVPEGPEQLQKSIDKAINHGRSPSKLQTLAGAKYCLLIHNQQFLHIPDWEQIQWPSSEGIDAIIVFHDQTIPPERTWRFMPPNCFGPTVTSGTPEDIESQTVAQSGMGHDQAIGPKRLAPL